MVIELCYLLQNMTHHDDPIPYFLQEKEAKETESGKDQLEVPGRGRERGRRRRRQRRRKRGRGSSQHQVRHNTCALHDKHTSCN